MASKKYLSLDEAAGQLNLANDQVVKLREEGKLRGFADRGTWKFKADDIEEYHRTQRPDSSPDVPIISDEEDSILSSQSGERLGSSSITASPSSVMSDDADPQGGDQPTVIRGDASGSAVFDDEPLLSSSDSDVRLYRDSDLSKIDSSPDVAIQRESDSDVRLAGDAEPAPAEPRSDSDVQLSGDEPDLDTVSDVRLLSDDMEITSGTAGSDSDVALVSPGSESDGGSVFDDELVSPTGDSGIALESIADSGIALDSSSHSAEIPDSGITLADDIGVGGSVIDLSEDSGIALDALNEGHSGFKQPDATVAEMNAADDSEFDLATGDDLDSSDDTSVILFDDDDSSFEVVSPSGSQNDMGSNEFSDSIVDLDEEEFEEADDDEMEFEAADEDFDDGFQTGESAADFAAPQQRLAVAPEPEIGGLAFAGLAISSVLLAVCGLMMFDLVRSMWGYHDPTVSSWLLESTKGLF